VNELFFTRLSVEKMIILPTLLTSEAHLHEATISLCA